MISLSRSHLPDHELLRALTDVVTRDRATTAEMLSLIGEVERRRLYAAAGFESMHRFCVGKLKMSGDMAYKRVRAARVSRRFPLVLDAVTDGRLNVSTLVRLAPHLKWMPAAAGLELLSAAEGKGRDDLELLIASRFPQADLPTVVHPVTPGSAVDDLAPGPIPDNPMTSALGDAAGSGSRSNGVDGSAPEQPSLDDQEFTPQASSPSPIPVSQYPRVSPLSPGRFALQLTMSQGTHDKLRRAQALLGHAIPSGEIAEVIDRALDALIANLERRKFGATDNPRDTRPTSSPRHIPARVRRAVRTRDKGQCTYVSHDGHRCEARTRLEYDHEVPLARGGKTSISNLRLRCRAHNQLEAERTFGAGFMEEKRKTARPPATLPTRHALPCTKAKNSSP
jgi:5-methylcytosine-specific restriction endonuclease McrA